MSSSHTIKADSFRVSTDGRTNDLEISKGSESVLKGNWKVDGSLKVEQGTDPKSPVTVSHLGEKLSSLKATVDNEVADTYVNKGDWNRTNSDLRSYTDTAVTSLSDSLPSDYMTLGSSQRVTGLKTFEGGFNIYYADKNTNKLSWKYDSDGIKILGGENFSQNVSFKLEPYQLKIGTITVWQLKSLGGDINQSITLPSKSGVVALVSDVDYVSDSLEILDITVGEISNNLDALSLVVADAKSDIRDLGDELNVVKSDVGDRYTKRESDAQLAVKADKAEVEAEAQARQEADEALGERIDSGDSKLSRAELIEKWRDKTYCELTITKYSNNNVARLPRIEANGIWWIDMDDGNGAQMRIDDNVQIEFDWGTQTEKKIVIYGNVTKIYNNIEDVDGNYRYLNEYFFVVSGIVESLHRALVFGGRWEAFSMDITILSKKFSMKEIFGAGPTVDKYPKYTQSMTTGREYKLKISHGEENYYSGFLANAKAKTLIVDSSAVKYFQIGGGANGSTFEKLICSVYIDESVGIGFGNFYAQKNLTYMNTALSVGTASFSSLYGMTDFVGTMPNLSDVPALFNKVPLNVPSIVGVLNKLPTYTDGGQHRIGFTVTGSTTAGIASEATTETFTATDENGTAYSVENCPRFINDDADSTLRKAYVLAIAKKGWEVII